MSYMSIDMHIDRSGLWEQLSHQSKSGIHILEIAHGSIFSHIAIGCLFYDGRLLVDSSSRESDLGSIVSLTIKWWINIDEINFASHTWEIIGFITYEQSLHSKEIVSVDQTIVSCVRIISFFEISKESLIVTITTWDDEFIGLKSNLRPICNSFHDFLYFSLSFSDDFW